MKYADGDAKDHAIGWSANDININNQIMETALLEWDGVQVGILGVSENWLGSIKDVNIKYENYITAARCAARKLKKNGAEVVLAITHNRLNNDRILTDAVPEIDLLLGGHDHEYTRDRRCRIVKSGQEWKWMSHIKMDFREEGKVPDVSVERYDIEEDIKEGVGEVERRAKRVKEELKDVVKAAKEVGNQVGDVAKASKGKPRTGRKPKNKK